MFATTAVYIGGEPPPQAAALNLLLEQPDAKSLFLALSRSSNNPTRLYALCGLQVLDLVLAQNLETELKAASGNVFVQDGCIGSNELVSEAADLVSKRSMGKAFTNIRTWTFDYYSKLASGKVNWTGICGQLGRQGCTSDD